MIPYTAKKPVITILCIYNYFLSISASLVSVQFGCAVSLVLDFLNKVMGKFSILIFQSEETETLSMQLKPPDVDKR